MHTKFILFYAYPRLGRLAVEARLIISRHNHTPQTTHVAVGSSAVHLLLFCLEKWFFRAAIARESALNPGFIVQDVGEIYKIAQLGIK